MIEATQAIKDMINSPIRRFSAKVELYNGSTLAKTFTNKDSITNFSIERVGEGKFFGFGICQKLKLALMDRNRELNLTNNNSFSIALGAGEDYVNSFPIFQMQEATRDENTNSLNIVAYDALYKASAHRVEELEIQAPYTIAQFATACASFLGLGASIPDLEVFNVSYETVNFEGTETIREALNAVAEATQTIYFVSPLGDLTFKRLDKNGEPALTIDKAQYITLSSKDNKTLSTIVSATELGDNISASNGAEGETQYIRNNPFWELQENIGELVEGAIEAVDGLTINQFASTWKGNFLLELGDKISFVTKETTTGTIDVNALVTTKTSPVNLLRSSPV